MKTSNIPSGVRIASNGYFVARILNYYPGMTVENYHKVMELEYHNRRHLQGISNALGFTFHTCPLVVVKEYYLEKYPNDIILAKYWTARIARAQSFTPTKQRRLQKAAGFATLYGGSTKVARIPGQP